MVKYLISLIIFFMPLCQAQQHYKTVESWDDYGNQTFDDVPCSENEFKEYQDQCAIDANTVYPPDPWEEYYYDSVRVCMNILKMNDHSYEDYKNLKKEISDKDCSQSGPRSKQDKILTDFENYMPHFFNTADEDEVLSIAEENIFKLFLIYEKEGNKNNGNKKILSSVKPRHEIQVQKFIQEVAEEKRKLHALNILPIKEHITSVEPEIIPEIAHIIAEYSAPEIDKLKLLNQVERKNIVIEYVDAVSQHNRCAIQ